MTVQSLEAASNVDRDVLITRLLDAPRELVFRAWTEARQLHGWYAPHGCTVEFRELDVRPGGKFHSCIRSSAGHACWCIGVYREIVPGERIVCTMAIADAEGNPLNPSDAGMDRDWPCETLLTITFADQQGKTKLTLHQTVSEALARRTGAYPSWLQMLARLDELLAAESPRIHL